LKICKLNGLEIRGGQSTASGGFLSGPQSSFCAVASYI